MRVNVDRMRRYSARLQSRLLVEDIMRSREAWLAAMAPEHREAHERHNRPVEICSDCINASARAVGQQVAGAMESLSRVRLP